MRTKQTEKRLNKVATKHRYLAKVKPLAASVGTGKPRKGFDYVIKAKQTKRK